MPDKVKEVTAKALGGKGKRYTPHEIHIQRTQNKGYVARHHLADKHGRPPSDGQRSEETYSLANHVDLLKHLTDHFGPEDEAAETGDDDELEEAEQYPEAGAGPRPVLSKGA